MLNKVQLIGRLGFDPEIKHFEGGNSVARLKLATDESYKDKDGNKKELTEWHTISVWGALAGVAEKYLKKGQLMYVEGRISTRTWQDDKGETRYSTEIRCESFKMLGRNEPRVTEGNAVNENNAQSNYSKPVGNNNTSAPMPVDDDLPF